MEWLPLESNPDVLNKFMNILGVPEKWNIVDVYGLDTDSLAWVPRPVLAVILLFPCSEKYYKYSEDQNKEIKEKGQVLAKDLFYLKQLVSNACGTVALVHSIGNNMDSINLTNEKFKQLLEEAKAMSSYEDRGVLLQKATSQIRLAHQELAQEGQTELNPNEQVNNHFVAFVHKEGNLYELDGRKEFPVNHGATTPDSLLEDAAKICKEFMTRDSEEVNFNVMALVATDN